MDKYLIKDHIIWDIIIMNNTTPEQLEKYNGCFINSNIIIGINTKKELLKHINKLLFYFKLKNINFDLRDFGWNYSLIINNNITVFELYNNKIISFEDLKLFDKLTETKWIVKKKEFMIFKNKNDTYRFIKDYENKKEEF
jgi:hypothetical protein